MMKSKIHKAKVTQANLNYIGSITIDLNLMEQANILANEKVQVVNNYNGARFETYVIPGERNSGLICLNGAASRLVQVGDEIIIISYGLFTEEEIRQYSPTIVFVDEYNRPVELASEETHGTQA
ncbi:MAG: Aspartate 1-decarboxylase [Candidatus Dichloromethanomonas elyunquensis]|nr:MAG: Aspartate 1-decarboxylase [Candidatus Dichloromethanomonas elyunquensis]